jgi:hypothetical protein
MITASATFTGKDGSLGFRTGQRYTIELLAVEGEKHKVELRVPGHPEQYCPYCCIETFLCNWTNVKTLNYEGVHNAN